MIPDASPDVIDLFSAYRFPLCMPFPGSVLCILFHPRCRKGVPLASTCNRCARLGRIFQALRVACADQGAARPTDVMPLPPSYVPPSAPPGTVWASWCLRRPFERITPTGHVRTNPVTVGPRCAKGIPGRPPGFRARKLARILRTHTRKVPRGTL